jgi:hypothetical protein
VRYASTVATVIPRVTVIRARNCARGVDEYAVDQMFTDATLATRAYAKTPRYYPNALSESNSMTHTGANA